VPARQGMTWEFDKLDRIEFGEIAEAPGLEGEYFSSGSAGPDVAREDLAVFKADATFYFEPGQQGSVNDGERQTWMWILVRGDEGSWRVHDWGY